MRMRPGCCRVVAVFAATWFVVIAVLSKAGLLAPDLWATVVRHYWTQDFRNATVFVPLFPGNDSNPASKAYVDAIVGISGTFFHVGMLGDFNITGPTSAQNRYFKRLAAGENVFLSYDNFDSNFGYQTIRISATGAVQRLHDTLPSPDPNFISVIGPTGATKMFFKGLRPGPGIALDLGTDTNIIVSVVSGTEAGLGIVFWHVHDGLIKPTNYVNFTDDGIGPVKLSGYVNTEGWAEYKISSAGVLTNGQSNVVLFALNAVNGTFSGHGAGLNFLDAAKITLNTLHIDRHAPGVVTAYVATAGELVFREDSRTLYIDAVDPILAGDVQGRGRSNAVKGIDLIPVNLAGIQNGDALVYSNGVIVPGAGGGGGGGGGGATNAYIGWLGSAADIRAPSTAMPSAPDGLRIPLARTTDFCEFRTFLPPGWRTNGTVTVRLLVPNTSTAPGTLRLSALGWKTSNVGVPSKPDYTASTNVSWAGNGVLSNILHAVVSPAIFTNTAAGDELWLMLEYVAGNTGEVSYVRIDY